MKLTELAKGIRPIFCRFDDLDDNHAGTITAEPYWAEDNYDSGKEMLVVPLDCNGVPHELRARGQMVEAIVAALSDTGAQDLVPGGFLSVTFTELRGKLKIYRAAYESPEDAGRDGGPIGVGQLESDDNQAVF